MHPGPWLLHSTLLLWCLAKTGSTYRTKQFRLQIPQFIMALDDKYDPFAYHSVIHMSPQTQTEGVSGTSHSYLSFRASLNSLLFKLDAPFWVARSTAVSSQSFSRNRALHLIKVPSSLHSLFVLHLEHLMLHNTCKVRISLSSSLCLFFTWKTKILRLLFKRSLLKISV